MAKALQLANQGLATNQTQIAELRDYLIDSILERFEHVRLNGHRTQRLPGNVNASFDFIEGESLLRNLDLKEIAASSGSACTSGSLDRLCPAGNRESATRSPMGRYGSL